MNKIYTTLAGILLVIAMLVATPALANSGNGDEPCVPSNGTAARYTEWTTVGDTIRTEDNTPPGADTDTVQYLANGTVTEQVQTGTTEVFDHWQRYSWNGPWESNTQSPPFPDARWQGNVEGDPHGVGVAGPYFRSNGNSGRGDWFYLEAVTKTVPTFESDTDYLWLKQVREFVPATDPVVCETEEPTPTDDPTETVDPTDDPSETVDPTDDPSESDEPTDEPTHVPNPSHGPLPDIDKPNDGIGTIGTAVRAFIERTCEYNILHEQEHVNGKWVDTKVEYVATGRDCTRSGEPLIAEEGF